MPFDKLASPYNRAQS